MADRPYGPLEWPPVRTSGHQHAPSRHVPRHSTDEWHTVRPPARRLFVRREDANPWHWLLFLPIVLPLVPDVYNRVDPPLLGLPFFYWCQLGFAFLASGVILVVHRKVR